MLGWYTFVLTSSPTSVLFLTSVFQLIILRPQLQELSLKKEPWQYSNNSK